MRVFSSRFSGSCAQSVGPCLAPEDSTFSCRLDETESGISLHFTKHFVCVSSHNPDHKPCKLDIIILILQVNTFRLKKLNNSYNLQAAEMGTWFNFCLCSWARSGTAAMDWLTKGKQEGGLGRRALFPGEGGRLLAMSTGVGSGCWSCPEAADGLYVNTCTILGLFFCRGFDRILKVTWKRTVSRKSFDLHGVPAHAIFKSLLSWLPEHSMGMQNY